MFQPDTPKKRCKVQVTSWWPFSWYLPWPGSRGLYWAIALFCIVVLVLVVYIQLVLKYGTLAPPAVAYYTRATPQGHTPDSYPPKGWRPNFRIVVSLTTTPLRLGRLSETITSLLEQSLQLDLIYVNIPTGPMKRHPERNYDAVEIPEFLHNSKSIRVLRTIDYGPATKLIPALLHEHDPTTLVITVDDDFRYPKRLIEALVWEANSRPDEALGVCGWSMMPMYGKIGIVPVYVPYIMRWTGRSVDILQSCCGNAYRRGFFSNISLLIHQPSVCVTVDDVWISGILAIDSKVNRAIISKRLDSMDTSWKQQEASEGDRAKMRLSAYNDENFIHYQCVRAIEDIFHTSWLESH